ncbi:hypothetical protein [uncultured Draconibacterium sp.]|uniref:hypothetical protein n=1 Tax=uncultured Draconibacterium sp. TaxID=1573823 RepID=UPI0025D117BF|nr:hypothetical protein [uncultured Draconibacterium sp.]
MNTTKSFYLKRTLLLIGLAFIFFNDLAAVNSSQTCLCKISESNVSTSNLSFNMIWSYLVVLLGPGVALYAVIAARPLLKRKLIENHVTQRIDQIHKSNLDVRKYCQKLISDYTPEVHNFNRLSKEDVNNLANALEKGYLIAQDSSTEVATLMYYLRSTVRQYARRFDYYDKTFNVFASDILVFVVNSLGKVVQYSSQVVPVPVKTEIKSFRVVTKPIKRFVSDGEMTKFKDFRFGVNYDKDSMLCLFYTDMVNATSMPYLKECAGAVVKTTKSIAKLLYFRKLYAPLLLEHNKFKDDPFFKRVLTLVGFDEYTKYNMGEKVSSETVVLYYSNLTSRSHKPKLTKESFANYLSDSWLDIKRNDLPKPLKFEYVTDEMIKVEYERNSLKQPFLIHKRSIKKKLKS